MPTLFDPVEIDTPRVKIRPLSATTWERLAEGLLYEDSWHGRMWNITKPEDVKTMYENGLKALEAKRGNPLVFLDDAGQVMGMTNFMNCEPQNKLTEIGGTWISKKWQRTHVNTETKYHLLKHCFESLGLKRVEFRIDHENKQSQRAMERLGVHFEGVIRNRRIIPSGESRDYHFYSVVDRDWSRVKAQIETLLGRSGANRSNEHDQQIEQPRLETERLILEPYKSTDIDDIFAYASHPEVSRYVPWSSHKTLDDSKFFLDFIGKSTNSQMGKLFFVFCIRLKSTGRVIGSIDFKNASASCGQIDYALGPAYWNKGIVTEAALAIKQWAFSSLPEMVRFQAFCVSENVGSSRVMEKIGMQKEGVRRKAFVLKGKAVDLTDYSIVREESAAVRLGGVSCEL